MLHFLILIIASFQFAQAHDGHELKSHHDFRALEEIRVQGGVAYILVHEGGHIAGQPFQIELRVQCDGDERPLYDLPVLSSHSVCDLDPNSFKVNLQQTAVAFKMKHADLNLYYDQVAQGHSPKTIQCVQKTSIKKFSLKGLCQRDTL